MRQQQSFFVLTNYNSETIENKLEYWLPGKTIEASGARQPVDDGNNTEWS